MNWLRHPLALLAFTLFSGLFSLSLYSSWRKNQASGGQVATLEQQVTQMTQELTALEKQLDIASSSASQEKIIRDQLLMQKPGERVMQIPDVPVETQTGPTATPSPTAWEEWQKILWE